VGLWGYCSGEEGISKYLSYSTPILLFSFNLVAILESNALDAALLLLDTSKAMLSRLLKLSRLAITVYIIRITITTLTIIVELFIIIFKLGAVPILISLLIS
jgi:hypothetical protein